MGEQGEMKDCTLVEVGIAAPADALWAAVRESDRIYNWFGWDAAGLKEEIDFIFFQHGKADDAARILRFDGTSDRFEVVPADAGSLLKVIRSVPAGERRDEGYDDMAEGWISFVQQLRFGIERHGLGPRRTLYLSGSARSKGTAPIPALRLESLVAASPGEKMSLTLPTGERFRGEAWHKSNWQVGVTVPDWGEGLLIATDKPVTEAAPDGRGMVILTTYGLDADEFAALEGRWRGWWDAHYAPSQEAACS